MSIPKARIAESKSPGVISLTEIYTLEEAKGRLRWSDAAFQTAKRRGLVVLASGKRRYLTGLAILEYLQSHSGHPR